MGDSRFGFCKTNQNLVPRAVFQEIKEDTSSPEGHFQQSCEVVDGPRVPEVAELVGDANERVPQLLCSPERADHIMLK